MLVTSGHRGSVENMKRSDSLSVTHITLLARASELKFTFDDQKKKKREKRI